MASCLFSIIKCFVIVLASVSWFLSYSFYLDNYSSFSSKLLIFVLCSFIDFYINLIFNDCSFLKSLNFLFYLFTSSIFLSDSSSLKTLFFIYSDSTIEDCKEKRFSYCKICILLRMLQFSYSNVLARFWSYCMALM